MGFYNILSTHTNDDTNTHANKLHHMQTRQGTTMPATNQLTTAHKDKEELAQYYKTMNKQINLLFKKEKKLVGTAKTLRKPNEPIVFVRRQYGQIDIYEGAKNAEFTIPPGTRPSDKMFQWGENETEKRGRRTARLSPSDLYTIPWGRETVKAYFVDENDGMCWNADPKVWSERLEYTIDAVLLNFENYKRKQGSNWDWVPKAILYTGLALALYFMARGLFPNVVPDLTNLGHAAINTTTNTTRTAIDASQITVLP
jgi:hypothetical protein